MLRRWLPLLVYWLQLPLYAGYLTDDSYIYAQFARNLAQHGEWAFNRGEAINAATSPLWALLGSAGVLMGLDPFWWLKLLGVLCGSLCVAFFCAALDRARVEGSIRWLAALAFAVQPWFVRWSASGMETAMASLCVIVALYALLGPRSPRDAWLLGASAGLGPLLRPELLLFSAIVGWIALRDARLRARSFALITPPLLLWGVFAWQQLHGLLPATMGAKSTDSGLEPARLFYNLRVLVQIAGVATGLPALAFVVDLAARRRLRLGGDLAAALVVWLIALPTVYLLRDVQVVSRYMEIWTPAMMLLAASQLREARFPRALFALQIVGALLLSSLRIAPSTRAFSESIDGALGDVAAWLREHAEPDDVVAAYDIGLIGYRSELRILDLGGLIHPGIAELRREYDDETIAQEGMFLRFGRPDFLVHRADRPQALAEVRWPGVELRPILSREVANLGVSRAEPVVYTLYELQ